MNREFREGLADMFSLMERMEKHGTLNEAYGNKKFYINESYSPNGAKVFVDLYSVGDNRYGVKIGGIWAEDAEEIAQNFGANVTPDPKNNQFAYLDFGDCGTLDEIGDLLQENIVDMGVFSDMVSGKYEQSSVVNLSNKDSWHFATGGRNVPDDKQKLLADIKSKSIAELKKDLANMLSSGDYSSFEAAKLGQMIVNLEREYGNVLSPNNVRAIEEQAAQYGLQPGDPDYPTFVVGEKTWVEQFGRNIVPNPKYPYYIEANKARRSSKETMLQKAQARGWDVQDKKGLGDLSSQVGYKLGFNDTEKNYGPSVAYNITDTVDTTGVDKFLNEMGLLNNLTGELNDLAKQDKEDYERRKEAAMNPEEKEAHDEEKRSQMEVIFLGKAVERVCNDMLSMKVHFNEQAPLQSYVSLLHSAAEKYASGTILKPNRLSVVSNAAALFMAHELKGIGAPELYKMAQSVGAVGSNAKAYSDDVLNVAQPLLKAIGKEYQKIEMEFVNKQSQSQAQPQAQPSDGGASQQAYPSVAESIEEKKPLLFEQLTKYDYYKFLMEVQNYE